MLQLYPKTRSGLNTNKSKKKYIHCRLACWLARNWKCAFVPESCHFDFFENLPLAALLAGVPGFTFSSSLSFSRSLSSALMASTLTIMLSLSSSAPAEPAFDAVLVTDTFSVSSSFALSVPARLTAVATLVLRLSRLGGKTLRAEMSGEGATIFRGFSSDNGPCLLCRRRSGVSEMEIGWQEAFS